MGMMRYVVDYNGMRYTMDAPEGTSASTLQAAITSQNAPAPAQSAVLPKPVAPEVTTRQSDTAAKIAKAQADIKDIDDQLAHPDRNMPQEYIMGLAKTREQRAADIGTYQDALAYMKQNGRLPPAPTAGSVVSDIVRGAPRALSQFPGQATEGVLGLVGSGLQMLPGRDFGVGKGIKELGTAAQRRNTQFAEDIFGGRSEASKFSPGARLAAESGEGIGSTVPYLLTEGLGSVASNLSKVGRAAKLAGEVPTAMKVARGANYAVAAGQGSQQSGQQAQQFRDQGGNVSPGQEFAARLVGAGLGLTEVGVASRMIEKLPATARGAAIDAVANFTERATAGRVAPKALFAGIKDTIQSIEQRAAGRIGLSAFEESLQEGGTQLGQNIAAKAIYNPNQDVTEGVGESALLGAIAGGSIKGGVEAVTGGWRSATTPTAKPEQVELRGKAPLETVDVTTPDERDPTKSVREKLDIMSKPDADGIVIVRDAAGKLVKMGVDKLELLRVPEEGHGATPVSDAFSREMIVGRVTNAAGESPTPAAAIYADKLGGRIFDSIALGKPREAANYLTAAESRFSAVRRKQAAIELATSPTGVTDPRLRVILEGKSILTDYMVEAAKQQAAPGASVGEPAPPPTNTIAQILERNSAAREAAPGLRRDLLTKAITDPNLPWADVTRSGKETTSVLPKHEAFASELEQHGLDAPTPAETATLNRVMQRQSEKTAPPVDVGLEKRSGIVEAVLRKTNLNADEKISRIYHDLMRGGMEPLSRAEEDAIAARIARRGTAENVFGPDGEYAARDVAPDVDEGVLGADETQPSELEGVPITKVAPGVARGVTETRTGQMGTQVGRPVEGAAELTAGMQDEQELTKRLNNMRNANLISDQDVGEVLNMVRVPTTKADLDALPESQRQRWKDAIDKQLEVNQRAEEYNAATGRAKKPLKASLDILRKQLDGMRGGLAKAAQREAQARVTKRQEQLRQIDASHAAGDITSRERDAQKAALRIETPMGPLLAPTLVTGERTESAQRSLAISSRTGSARAVLQDLVAQGGPLGEIAQRVLDVMPSDIRMAVIDAETIRLIARKKNQPLSEVPDLEGVYDPTTHTVYLDKQMTLDHVPIHETIHALTAWHIENNTPIGAELSAIYKMFKELAPESVKDHYGLTDAHEFVAEVYSNEAFRKVIRDLTPEPTPEPTKAEPEPRSLLQRVVDAVKSIFTGTPKARGASPAEAVAEAAPVTDYIEKVLGLADAAAREKNGYAKEPRSALGGRNAERPEEMLEPDDPNYSKPDTVGLMASMQKSFRQFVADMMAKPRSTFQRKINYKYQDAVDFDKWLASAYGVDQLPEDMSVANKAELFEARKNGKQLALDRTYIKPILNKMAELGLTMDQVGKYLWARGAVDRNTLVRSRNGQFPTGGSGLLDSEAIAILKNFIRKGFEPDLAKIGKMHDQLVDAMNNVRVQEGLLTRKQVDAFRKTQPYYASLKGFAADGDMQISGDRAPHSEEAYNRNLGIRRTESAKVGGRGSMPFNPLVNMFVDAKRLVQRVEVNRVGKQLLENIMSDPGTYADVAAVYSDTNPKVRRVPSKNLSHPDGMLIRANMRNEAEKYLVVKKDGIAYYVDFKDTEAGRAMKRMFANMTPKELSGAMKGIVVTANFLKSLTTRFSPKYLPKALLRDVQDAVQAAYAAETDKRSPAFGKKLGTKVLAYTSATTKTGRLVNGAITRYLSGGEPKTEDQVHMSLLLEQMIEGGGSPGHAVVHDIELLTTDAVKFLKQAEGLRDKDPKAYAKAVATAIPKALDAASQFTDLKARLATYVAALEEGISEEGANRLALNSSLDLTRRGEWGRTLDAVFFFTSPSVESSRKLVNMLRSKNGRRIIVGQMLVLGAGSVIFNSLMAGGDDDDDGIPNYMEVPSGIRQANLVLFWGPGPDDYVPFPLGFMAGLPAYIGQKATETVLGDSTPGAAATSIVSAVFTTFSPVRAQGEDAPALAASVTPNLAKPPIEILFNTNYFGTNIHNKQYDTSRAASAGGRESTAEAYKYIAMGINELMGGTSTVPSKWADWAPEDYRHLVEGYGGGAYGTAKDIVNFATEDNHGDKTLVQRIPILKSYVGSGSEYAPMNKYYKHVDRMDAIALTDKHGSREEKDENIAKFPIQTDSAVLNAYNQSQRSLDRIGRRQREALRGIEDPDRRRTILDRSREEKNVIFKDFNRIFNEADKRQ